MRAYAHGFSRDNTLVFRATDLVLRWAPTIAALATCLQLRDGVAPAHGRLQDVNRRRNPRSRSLDQAIAHYREPRNRAKGFSKAQLRYLSRRLDRRLMERWGYQPLDLGPVASGDVA